MKAGVAIFLLLMVCCQLSNRMLITAVFYANQDYIAAHLCENKDKPEMHCNGKCQLTKKLKENTSNLPFDTHKKNVSEIDLYFFHPKAAPVNRLTIEAAHPQYGIYIELISQEFSPTLFHPPTV